MNLIDFLKEYFDKNKITQLEIEKRTGIDQYKLSLTFNKKRKLTADELMLIAKEFDINLEDIKKKLSTSDQT